MFTKGIFRRVTFCFIWLGVVSLSQFSKAETHYDHYYDKYLPVLAPVTLTDSEGTTYSLQAGMSLEIVPDSTGPDFTVLIEERPTTITRELLPAVLDGYWLYRNGDYALAADVLAREAAAEANPVCRSWKYILAGHCARAKPLDRDGGEQFEDNLAAAAEWYRKAAETAPNPLRVYGRYHRARTLLLLHLEEAAQKEFRAILDSREAGNLTGDRMFWFEEITAPSLEKVRAEKHALDDLLAARARIKEIDTVSSPEQRAKILMDYALAGHRQWDTQDNFTEGHFFGAFDEMLQPAFEKYPQTWAGEQAYFLYLRTKHYLDFEDQYQSEYNEYASMRRELLAKYPKTTLVYAVDRDLNRVQGDLAKEKERTRRKDETDRKPRKFQDPKTRVPVIASLTATDDEGTTYSLLAGMSVELATAADGGTTRALINGRPVNIPPDMLPTLHEGYWLYRRGDYARAADALASEAAVEANPLVRSWKLILAGHCHLLRDAQNVAQAAELYRQAAEATSNPLAPYGHYYLVHALALEGQYDLAYAELNALLDHPSAGWLAGDDMFRLYKPKDRWPAIWASPSLDLLRNQQHRFDDFMTAREWVKQIGRVEGDEQKAAILLNFALVGHRHSRSMGNFQLGNLDEALKPVFENYPATWAGEQAYYLYLKGQCLKLSDWERSQVYIDSNDVAGWRRLREALLEKYPHSTLPADIDAATNRAQAAAARAKIQLYKNR